MCLERVFHLCPPSHRQVNTVTAGYPALVDPERFINPRDPLQFSIHSAASSTDSKSMAFNYWCLGVCVCVCVSHR
jgi:hypothetical protein